MDVMPRKIDQQLMSYVTGNTLNMMSTIMLLCHMEYSCECMELEAL